MRLDNEGPKWYRGNYEYSIDNGVIRTLSTFSKVV